jgi:hypothetical protein
VQHFHLGHGFFKEDMRLRRLGGNMHARRRVMREGQDRGPESPEDPKDPESRERKDQRRQNGTP